MNNVQLRKSIRRAANVSGTTIPIVIIDGDSSPKINGSRYHYRNIRGDLIHYPNAYHRAWGKPVYIPSTIRIEVGSDWPMHVGLISKKMTPKLITCENT